MKIKKYHNLIQLIQVVQINKMRISNKILRFLQNFKIHKINLIQNRPASHKKLVLYKMIYKNRKKKSHKYWKFRKKNK